MINSLRPSDILRVVYLVEILSMIHDRSNLNVAYGEQIYDNSTYDQVKAWSRQAESYHLSRREPHFMTPHDMMLPVLNELKSSLWIVYGGLVHIYIN